VRDNATTAPSNTQERGARTPTILLVDDDPQLRAMLGYALRLEGFRVDQAASGEEALARLEDREPDIILLDVLMPGLGGLEACRRIRERSSVPIIMLTALGCEKDIVAGLQAGADDFCTKPIGLAPLAARIRAHLRRRELDATSGRARTSVAGGDLAVDSAARQAIVAGRAVDLSQREFGLLERLTRSPGRVVSHQELVEHVWGSRSPKHLGHLRTYIRRLRQKIEPDPDAPRYIHSRPRLGYILTHRPQNPEPMDTAQGDATACC
jgi:DNA-binding response OmpR family regulator